MLYEELMQMTCAIQTHVLQYGHVVAASDNHAERTLGYTCMGCKNGVDCIPQTVTWEVGFDVLRDMGVSTIFGISVPRLLKRREVRGQLTRYLNGIGGSSFNVPNTPVIDRYHRPWVI